MSSHPHSVVVCRFRIQYTDRSAVRSKLPHPLHTALCIGQVTDIEFVSVRVLWVQEYCIIIVCNSVFVYYRVVIFINVCNSNSEYLEKEKKEYASALESELN